MRRTTSPRGRRLRQAIAALVLAALGMIVGAGTASAHAVLLSTTPGNGQVLDQSPTSVSMRFSEAVDLGMATIRLIGPDGHDVAGLPPAAHPTGQQHVVALAVPGVLPTGTYVVSWRVISADTHPVNGAFTFSVGQPSTAATAAAVVTGADGDGTVNLLYGLSRWLAYLGLAIGAGSAFFVAFCWPSGARVRRARKLFWTGWSVLAGSTVLAALVYGPYADGESVGGMVSPRLIGLTMVSQLGFTLLLRAGLLAAVAVGVRLWSRRNDSTEPDGRTRLPAAAVVSAVTAAFAVTWSLATHSASDSQAVIAVPADVLHLCAMSVWLGGLVMLLAVLLRTGDVTAMRQAVPRFSRTAAVCVVVLVVTGVYQAWRQIGSFGALVDTSYGVLLLVKVGAVAVLVGLGGLSRRWTRRQLEHAVVTAAEKRRAKRGPAATEVRRFRRTIIAETVVAAALLGLTSALVTTEPARAVTTAKTATVAAAPASTVGQPVQNLPFDAGDGITNRGLASIEFAPGKAGQNQVHVQVLDLNGNPWEVPEVRGSLSMPARGLGPIPVPLQEVDGLGHYSSSILTLPFTGQWVFALTVRTSDVDETTVRMRVDV